MTLVALQQAKSVYDRRLTATKEQKLNNVIELNEWGIFSNAQLSKLTGLREKDVAGITAKTDHTGGRFDGEALAPLIEIIQLKARAERDDRLFWAALEHASVRMVAKLTGFSRSTVQRALERRP